jgi:hypothetical protein
MPGWWASAELRPAGIAATALPLTAALRLLAGLAAGGLLPRVAAAARLVAQLSHTDSSLSAPGMT